MLLAADGEGGGFQPPSIVDFFPAPFLFEGTLFEFNRMQLVRLIAAVAVILFFVLAARRAKVVPGKLQSLAELVVTFVKVNIAEDIIGKDKGGKYAAFLTTVFASILFFNLSGIVPGLNIAGTSLIGLPIMFALWVYVMYLGAGVRQHGVGGFLKTSLFPPGVPPFLYVLLTPVEFLTVFVLRPATLALRLMANMVAGHLMLVLCFGATHYFVLEAVPAMKGFGALTLVGGIAITLFEVFVSVLQAYIFVVLAAVYLSLSVAEEH